MLLRDDAQFCATMSCVVISQNYPPVALENNTVALENNNPTRGYTVYNGFLTFHSVQCFVGIIHGV